MSTQDKMAQALLHIAGAAMDLACSRAAIRDAALQALAAHEAEQAAQPEAAQAGWKHDCAALLQNDVELWVPRCPHCGKPSPSLTAEQERDKLDAERYRWLRDPATDLDSLAELNWLKPGETGEVYSGTKLDAAIDSARASMKEQQ